MGEQLPSAVAPHLMEVDGWVAEGPASRDESFYTDIATAIGESLGVQEVADLADDYMRTQIIEAAEEWKKDKDKQFTAAHVSLALRGQKAAAKKAEAGDEAL